MKYAVDISSGAIIYVPILIKIGSAIQKLKGGGAYIDTQHGDGISLPLLFSQ
jgi:hypothetical protein